jgi:hypothetical protein
MALAIDASTPAYKSTGNGGNTGTLTTASFTPPLGSLLVVMWAIGSTASQAMVKPTNTGGAVTWDAAVAISEAANGCCAAIWMGTVTTSASMTVTETLGSGLTEWGFGVAVVTGQAASPKGATQPATAASAALPSGTIASLTGSNSLIVASVSNYTDATVGTPGTGQSVTFNGLSFSGVDTTNGGSEWAQYLTGMNLAAGASATINDTAPSIVYSMAMLEILAAAGAAAAEPDLTVAPMQSTDWG